MSKLRTSLIGVLGAIALAVAGCSSADGSAKPAASGLNDNNGNGIFSGFGLVPAQPRPQFTLTDTSGASYPFAAKTQGRTTLLFFGYTNCPDICPITMNDIAAALRTMPAKDQQKVTVVFASTDVKHDTGPIIDKWLSYFTPNTHATFVGLRGTQAQVDAAEAAAHIMIASDGGQTHSTQVIAYSPDDYAHDQFIYSGNTEKNAMAHDLPLLVAGRT